MSQIRLANPYVSILKEGNHSFGGSQTWCRKQYLKDSGCGLISGTDLLLYLEKKEKGISWEGNGSEEYLHILEYMRKHFFPVIPRIGKTGWGVALGVWLFCRLHGLSYSVRFGVMPSHLWMRMSKMLEEDIPVVLTVGPNFPKRWEKEGVTLYRKSGVEYMPAVRIQAHFVTVTGMEQEWLQVSSWGMCYYIRKEEYWDYAKKHSNFVMCNMLYLKKR